MKRLILISISLFIVGQTIKAQQLPLYSQYMMNGFLLNPAITGSESYTPVRITARQQWIGIEGAPSTQAISAHHPFKSKNMGVGGYLFNDKFGPVSRTGILTSYAYHINLNRMDSKLGFGLSVCAFQYKMDELQFIY